MESDPRAVGTSALLALALTLLLAFPGSVFNSTLEEHYEEVKGWFSGLMPAIVAVKKAMRKIQRSWIGLTSMIIVSGALYGLLSPDFGLNQTSLILVLAIASSILVLTIAAEVVAGLWVQRRFGKKLYLKVFPATIAIAVVCVALSRLLDFQPGYLYGLVAGAAFRGGLARDEEGKSLTIAYFTVFAISVIAWLAWTPVQSIASEPGASLGWLVLEAFLVATFVSGLEGLLFGLLPLRFLDGQKLMSWNRITWLILFWVSMLGFLHILLRPDSGYIGFSEEISLWLVAGLLVAFGLVSLSFWGYFRFRPART